MAPDRKIPKGVRLGQDGLIPAIVQDHRDDRILMMAYMNAESLARTIRTQQVHFWSRSRKTLWRKGATSGNRMRVEEIRLDCDGDALLVRVLPEGPACHTGEWSCFHRSLYNGRFLRRSTGPATALVLDRIFDVICDRKRHPRKGSYVSSLIRQGRDAILKKIGEESGELIIGSKNNRRAEIIWEAADVWFHTLVLMGYHNISPLEIYKELQRRFGKTRQRRRK